MDSKQAKLTLLRMVNYHRQMHTKQTQQVRRHLLHGEYHLARVMLGEITREQADLMFQVQSFMVKHGLVESDV